MLLQLTGFTPHKVNGLYRIRETLVGGRPSFISTSGMVLWHNIRNSWWMVSPKSKVNTDKCYVYAYDTAEDPLEVTATWKYFDSKAPGGGCFREEEFALVLRPENSTTMLNRQVNNHENSKPEPGHRRVMSESRPAPDADSETFTYAARANRFNRPATHHERSHSEDVGLRDRLYPTHRDLDRGDVVGRGRRNFSPGPSRRAPRASSADPIT